MFLRTYIDNSNVDYTCLNRRGLHLNKKGSTTLSKNYGNYFNNQKLNKTRPGVFGLQSIS